MINALRYTRVLEDGGFSEDQALTVIKVLSELMTENFSTKQDIKLSELALKSDMDKRFASVQADFAAVREEMRTEFANVRAEMKDEFANVRAEMKDEFANVRAEMKDEFANVRAEMKDEFAGVHTKIASLEFSIQNLENKMTLKLSGIMIGVVTISQIINKML